MRNYEVLLPSDEEIDTGIDHLNLCRVGSGLPMSPVQRRVLFFKDVISITDIRCFLLFLIYSKPTKVTLSSTSS